MILDARKGFRGRVYDVDTGKEILCPIVVNTDNGYFEAYQTDPQGNILRNAEGVPLVYHAVGNLRIEERDKPKPVKSTQGALVCSGCQSPLTLPGEERCPFCKAKDLGHKKFHAERIKNPLLDVPCCKCSNLAEWQVADEVEVSPIKSNGILWDRGAVVGQRYYCSRCYQPPRLLDAKGEIVEEFEEAGGVRPQW